MHIIIGLLSTTAGVIWALYHLHNSGVNLNAFNPFYFIRRRSWEKQLGTKPLHRLENSMEAAAVLIVGIAKINGDITREQKQEIFGLFEQEFQLAPQKASELFASSCFLLQDVFNLEEEVRKILAPTKDSFTEKQVRSLLTMLEKVASREQTISEIQLGLLQRVNEELNIQPATSSSW